MSSNAPLRILIMEDDVGQARLAQRALQRAGYEVEVAHDGESGLSMFQANTFDVLIVDHQMPEKDGIEVLHMLVAWNALSPTIMVTGNGDEAVAVEAMKLGAGDYIVKDVDGNYLTLLPAVIERLLDQQRLVEEKQQAESALHQTLQELEERVASRTADLQRSNEQLRAEIAERARVEEALRQSEARNRSIVETAIDGIITIDERGTVESFNSAAEHIFGYHAADVIGQNVNILMPSPDREQHDTYLKHYLQTGERKIIGIGREVVGLHQDGTTFSMDLAVGEMLVGDRRMFTGIVRNITDRKQAAQEMQRADRLALVGQLASGLAHEIGTPLNVIAGNAELLRMDLQAQQFDTDILEAIVRQTDRITGLVQQLLTFARAKNEAMGPFPLREPLFHALRLLETRLSHEGITTSIHVPENLPLLWGAADQVEQVFLNVLVNAWHAMPDGGEVTIHAHELDKDQVQITFRDTGMGMTAEAIDKAFDPFFSTKGEQGTGLGLAICKQIIDNHQGQMRLESTPGAGATIIIDFIQANLND
ncbi:hybrid sensor histidine kinase/response regulator [Candidatus Entotheonella palauensis]|uniref:hybrid sensor histidine kinase/response regulator n=1 Tax=Candidatus Entotheonella palauensis TaxID=93172 RepID=UPI0015C42DBA|nr:PAS domain S-box protein [Candidatus Entotheonella palauensis]